MKNFDYNNNYSVATDLYALRHTTPWLVTFDWGSQVRFVIGDDIDTIHTAPDLESMLQWLDENYPGRRFLIVGEASFGSYVSIRRATNFSGNRKEYLSMLRDKFIMSCRHRGHDLRKFHTRVTKKVRKELYGVEKEEGVIIDIVNSDGSAKRKKDPNIDVIDSKVILHIVRNTKKDLTVAHTSKEMEEYGLRNRLDLACEELNFLRFTNQKDEFGKDMVAMCKLPFFPRKKARKESVEIFDEIGILAWGDSTLSNYNYSSLVAVGLATYHAKNERDFERILGFRESSAKSLLRSDMFHHRWRWIKRRPEEKQLTFSQYNHELRKMYRRLKPLIKQVHDKYFN